MKYFSIPTVYGLFLLFGMMMGFGLFSVNAYAEEEPSQFSKWDGVFPGDTSQFAPHDIVIDYNGNIYLINKGSNTILKLDSEGKYITSWGSSGAGKGQFFFPEQMSVDSKGNLYVVDSGNYRIQKFSSDGAYLAEWSMGSIEETHTPAGIAVDSLDNLYMYDEYGGSILKYTTDGKEINIFALPAADSLSSDPNSIAVDSLGNIFALRDQEIFKFGPDGTLITKWGSFGENDDQFTRPFDLTLDSSGNVFVTDYNSNRITKFSNDGEFITKWGSEGNGQSQFEGPWAIAADKNGDVYVVENHNLRIQKFSNDGKYVASLSIFDLQNGPYSFESVASDSSGNLYSLQSEMNLVIKYAPDGDIVDYWSLQESQWGQFFFNVDVDSKDHIYVLNSFPMHSVVLKFSNDGKQITQWNVTKTETTRGGLLTGIAVDSKENVFVADSSKNIQKFSSDGNLIATWSTNEAYSLVSFISMALDSKDNIYVLDTGDSKIQKFSNDGSLLASWSLPTGESALYNYLRIEIDSEDNLYVGDGTHSKILQYSLDGDYLAEWNIPDVNQVTHVVDIKSGAFPNMHVISLDGNGWNVYNFDASKESKSIPVNDDSGILLSPLKQLKSGILNDKIICRDGLQLFLRSTDNMPVCITLDSVEKLLDRKFMVLPEQLDNVIPIKTPLYQDVESTSDNESLYITIPDWPQSIEHSSYVESNGMITDSANNVYSLQPNKNMVLKFSPNGEFLTQWNATLADAKDFPYPYPTGFETDSAGNIYVNNGFYFEKYTADGKYITDWRAVDTENDDTYAPALFSIDSTNNFYVLDYQNDAHVKKSSSDGQFIVDWDLGDLRAIAMTVDSNENLFLLGENNIVVKLPKSGSSESWGSYGELDGQFNNPIDIDVDSSGNVYVSDNYNNRIQKFSGSGEFIEKWNLEGSPRYFSVDSADNVNVVTESHLIKKFSSDGTLLVQWNALGLESIDLVAPEGVATDSDGNVYVSDASSGRIVKLDQNGNLLMQWGMNGKADGQFNQPLGMALDSSDNVYVADSDNYRIQKFSSDGTFLAKWGSASFEGGDFTSWPTSLAFDSSDSLYVITDDQVYKFSSGGVLLEKFAIPVTNSDMGIYPQDIVIDFQDNLYISDSGGQVMLKMDSNGNLLQVFAAPDGHEGQFYPSGIGIDSKNKIYVVEEMTQKIMQYSVDGNFITSWVMEVNPSASYSSGLDMTIDQNNRMYIATSGQVVVSEPTD